MPVACGHLGVLIGASPAAEHVRRSLLQAGVPHLGAAMHLRGLRQRLLCGEGGLILVCAALNTTTLRRYGDALAQLLAEAATFPGTIRSIGLLPDYGLTPRTAQLGCDIYLHAADHALQAIDHYRRHYKQTMQHRAIPPANVRIPRSRLNRTATSIGYGAGPEALPRPANRFGEKDPLPRMTRFFRSSRTERPAADFWDFDASL